MLISLLNYFYILNYERPFFSSFDYIFYDFKQKQFLNENSIETKITTVEIDESALIEFGRWPWPRQKTAELIEKIVNKGASKVILDIVFSEVSEPSQDQALKATIEKYNNKVVLGAYVNSYTFSNSMAEKKCLQDFIFSKKNSKTSEQWANSLNYKSDYSEKFSIIYEELLSEYLKDKKKTSAFDLQDSELYYLSILNGQHIRKFCNSLASSRQSVFFKKFTPSDIVLNYDELQNASLNTGAFSVLPDIDSAIRRYYLKYEIADLAIPTSAGITSLAPTRLNSFWINYTSKTPLRIEASKILKDEIVDLKDHIVLLGVTAPGVYDIRKTPVNEALPGTYILAQAASNLKNSNYLLYCNESNYLFFVMLMFLGIMIISHKNIKWTTSLIVFFLILSFLIILEYLLFKKNLFFWSFEFYFFWGVLFIFNNYLYYKEESSQKLFITQIFSKYVSDKVVKHILNSPEKIKLTGEKKKLTVFFSDIRSFTSISENLDPVAISQFLNIYFEPMVETIKENEGTLDKFIGDGLMAFFGAPIDSPKNAKQACISAIRCIENLKSINEKIKDTINTEIDIGIGLNYQEIFVGNIGTSNLQSYTVIGDGVNLASRLQALTKNYGVKIITSETIYLACKDEFQFKKLDEVKVKGRIEPISIYELVLQTSEEKQIFQDQYEAMLNDFFCQNLSSARLKIDQLLELYPNDTPLKIINSRLIEIEKNPILNWDLYKFGSFSN